jgi:hypothetical protein
VGRKRERRKKNQKEVYNRFKKKDEFGYKYNEGSVWGFVVNSKRHYNITSNLT